MFTLAATISVSGRLAQIFAFAYQSQDNGPSNNHTKRDVIWRMKRIIFEFADYYYSRWEFRLYLIPKISPCRTYTGIA